jgi:outer membrane lipoprotein-sorting protein
MQAILNLIQMKKLFTSVFFLMLSVLFVSAQQKGLGNNDPEAKKVLDAVSAKFKSFKGVQAKFSLKIENGSGKTLGTKTGIVYMKASKYRVTITGQEIYCDGINISTYDKSANEVSITKIDPSANSITPQKIFTNFYDKDFLYKLNQETTVAGKKIQEIELTPTDKSKPFFKVLVYVDKAAQTITSTKVFEKTGNKYTYAVTNMNTTTPINDAQFVFDAKKYPGVEVVDLR